MTTLHTHVSPVQTEGYTAVWETSVHLGKNEGYASLNVTGTTYAADYDYASIGLQAGEYIDLGVLAAPPNIAPSNSFSERPAGNVSNSGIFQLSDEGLEVTTPLMEVNPNLFAYTIPNGIAYDMQSTTEIFVTAGGACSISTVPLFISAYNKGCYGVDTSDITTNIRGFAMTIWKVYCSSGLNFGDLISAGDYQLDLTWTATSWNDRILGNRFFSLLAY